MEYLLLGFFTGLSLILAIGAQNIFVIEQGLKKQHVFLVCLVCSISDLILIFLGIFIFEFFSKYFNSTVELIFNIALVIFLIHFIYSKIKNYKTAVNFDTDVTSITAFNILLKNFRIYIFKSSCLFRYCIFSWKFFKKFHNQSKNIFWNRCVNCFFFIFFS
jgi:L-lysine exporter family protein LysE/ArgO